jgi:SAM-dependent methyltransferase
MATMRQHYEERFAQDDPYECGKPENRFWLMLGQAKLDLVTRIAKRWTIRRSIDVGCGDWGIFHQAPVLLGSELAVAGDLSFLAVKKARENSDVAHKTQFAVFDAERPPFRSHAFDVVYCSEVVEHVVDARRTMLELARLSNHRVITSVPNEELVGKMDPEHLHTFGYDTFRDLVQEAGLRIINGYGIYLFLRPVPSHRLPFLPLGTILIKILMKLGEWVPRRGIQILVVAEGQDDGGLESMHRHHHSHSRRVSP